MSRRPPELIHGGSRYVVVPRSQVEQRPSELDARRLVEDALREGGVGTAAGLERLAEGLVGRAVESTREAAGIVVRGLVEGRLVAVAWPSSTRALAAVEVTDLRTLGGWEVEEPLRSRVTPRDPTPVEPTTWVSFEVVDERGVAADGSFRVALDGRVEEGALEQKRHRFDGLRPAGPVQLVVEDIRWDATTHPHAPWHEDDPRPGGDGLFSVDLVDERGEPLRGRFSLTEGNRLLAEGVLAHRWRRALPEGEPVMLELSELRPQGEP
jgi:hypothetical protein